VFLSIPTAVLAGPLAQSELEEFSSRFVENHRTLWNITADGPSVKLEETSVLANSTPCRYVTFQLTKNNLPVLNSSLRFSFVERENQFVLKSILGRVDGRDFALESQQLTKRETLQRLGGEFVESAENDLSFAEGVIDPFFLDDSPHSAGHGYFGRSLKTGPEVTLVAAQSKADGHVVSGWGYTHKPSQASTTCVFADPTAWMPAIRIDVETETPSSISFSHFGGIPVAGRDLTERANAFLALPEMKAVYGDFRPDLHMVPLRVREDANAYQVEYQQRVGSLPVYASGFVVRFSPSTLNVIEAFGARVTAFRADSFTFPVAASIAADTAWAKTEHFYCKGFPGCAQAPSRPSAAIEQVVFSPRLIHLRGGVFEDRPAWLIDSKLSEVLVDGVNGSILFFNPKAPVAAAPFTLDWNRFSPPPRLATNGVVTTTGAGVLEAVDLNAVLTQVGSFYETAYPNLSGAGRFLGFDGTNVSTAAFFGCSEGSGFCAAGPAYFRSFSRSGVPTEPLQGIPPRSLFFPAGWSRSASGAPLVDAAAHEWAHGITDAAISWRLLACEERALDESISDILAETAFPSADGSWTIFEGTVAPPAFIRNLQSPLMPVYNRPISSVPPVVPAQDLGTCDLTPNPDNPAWLAAEADAYRMSGVSSKMAQLIADGAGPHAGIGRLETHKLVHFFVQSKRLAGGRLVLRDFGDGLVRACRSAAASSAELGEFNATFERCDLITRAAQETRLNRPARWGWFSVEGYGVYDPRSTLAVGKLNPQCSIASQQLRVLTSYGSIFTMELTTAPEPRNILILNGESEVRVLRRGADTDPLDRLVEVDLRTHYGVHRQLEIELLELFQTPPGWSQSQCLTTPGKHHRVLLSGRTYFPDPFIPDPSTILLQVMPTQYFSKWDAFGSTGFVRLDGIDLRAMVGTVDGTAAGAVTVPSDGRCALVSTTVRELRFGNHSPNPPAGVVMPLMSVLDHYSHSYSLQSELPAAQTLFVRVAWRQHVGARCAFQVAWEFEEQDGEDCLAIVNALPGGNGAVSASPIADRACTEPECAP
jgi:hypothetical protein